MPRLICRRVRTVLSVLIVFCLGAVAASVPTDEEGFGSPLAPRNGFEGKVYAIPEGTGRLPDFRTLQPLGVIYAPRLDVEPRNFGEGFPGVTDRFEWFAIRYAALFEVDEPATYQFRLTSDDGSRLIIDDSLVIDNDGRHSVRTAESTILLEEGVHCMRVDYFQGPRFEVALVLEASKSGAAFTPFDVAALAPRLEIIPVYLAGAGPPALGAYPDPFAETLARMLKKAPFFGRTPGLDPLSRLGERSIYQPRGPWQPPGWGGRWRGIPGQVSVPPRAALQMFDRWTTYSRPPFLPEKGRGAVSWFTTEGNPYVGAEADSQKRVRFSTRLLMPERPLVVDTPTLEHVHRLYQREITPELIEQVRQNWQRLLERDPSQRSRPVNDPLGSKTRYDRFNTDFHKWSERKTWRAVGRAAREHPSRGARVVLNDTYLSRQGNGEFSLLAETERIRIDKSPLEFYNLLKDQGVLELATPEERARFEAKAAQLRRGQLVRTGVRVGGRVLLFVAVAHDGYRLYKSPDKARTAASIGGGWAGALALGTAFATWFAPADVAGPGAWLVHGVGTLIAGVIGYLGGAALFEGIYDALFGDDAMEADLQCFERPW